MTVRVETEPGDNLKEAVTHIELDLPGHQGADVRLLHLAAKDPEVGITVFSADGHSIATVWLDPEPAYHMADVLDLLATWPAEGIAALAGAVRRSVMAFAPAGFGELQP